MVRREVAFPVLAERKCADLRKSEAPNVQRLGSRCDKKEDEVFFGGAYSSHDSAELSPFYRPVFIPLPMREARVITAEITRRMGPQKTSPPLIRIFLDRSVSLLRVSVSIDGVVVLMISKDTRFM